MNYKNSKKGAQGVGTLIIFISLILVAAVAAGVLIQTASSLQSKSLDVGRQSQEKITTDIEVVQVYTNDTSDTNITDGTDTITTVVRLGSGSSPVKLEDLLIRFDTQDGSQTLIYGTNASNPAEYNTTNYGIVYKIQGSTSQVGYLNVGDLAEISFQYNAGNDITEGQTATLRLVAKNGAIKPVKITTPPAMLDIITYLYP